MNNKDVVEVRVGADGHQGVGVLGEGDQMMPRTRSEFVKLQIVSDIHLCFKRKMYFVEPAADYLLVCGDIEAYFAGFFFIKRFLSYHSKLFKKVFWIIGNHESMAFSLSTVPMIAKKCERLAKKTGTIFLHNNSYEVEPGLVIIGSPLFSLIPTVSPTSNKWSPGTRRSYTRLVHEKRKGILCMVTPHGINKLHIEARTAIELELRRCIERQQTAVVMTHFGPLAPSDSAIHRRQWFYNPEFTTIYNTDEDMESILRVGKGTIGLWAFGHDHVNFSFKYRYNDGTWFDVVSNQLGNVKQVNVARSFRPTYTYCVRIKQPK